MFDSASVFVCRCVCVCVCDIARDRGWRTAHRQRERVMEQMWKWRADVAIKSPASFFKHVSDAGGCGVCCCKEADERQSIVSKSAAECRP